MRALGLQPLPASWLLQTSRPLTPAQVDIARRAAASSGLYVQTRQPRKSLASLRNWSTVVGILLALGVLGMTIGLIRSETADDLRILLPAGKGSMVANLAVILAGLPALATTAGYLVAGREPAALARQRLE